MGIFMFFLLMLHLVLQEVLQEEAQEGALSAAPRLALPAVLVHCLVLLQEPQQEGALSAAPRLAGLAFVPEFAQPATAMSRPMLRVLRMRFIILSLGGTGRRWPGVKQVDIGIYQFNALFGQLFPRV